MEQDWENAKENFQPLKAGRDPRVLQGMESTPQAKRSAEGHRRWVPKCMVWHAVSAISLLMGDPPECRQLLTQIEEYQGDDPLELWLR